MIEEVSDGNFRFIYNALRFVVFCISLMPISTANKVFATTLILTNIILITLFEAGIIFQ